MYIYALILGLISSLHCVAMCGPIVLLLPIDRSSKYKKIGHILCYHFGRFIAYGLLGVLFGMIGKGLSIAGFQQKLSIVAGICIILVALISEKRIMRIPLVQRYFLLIKSQLNQYLSKPKKARSITIIGFFNGLLPCAMIYGALFGALSMGAVYKSGIFMLVFGLGTLPLLSLVFLISDSVKQVITLKFQNVLPLMAVIIGILLILRGAGLDVGMLSPSSLDFMIRSNPNCG